jgi:predicted transposase YbfD/YdcC
LGRAAAPADWQPAPWLARDLRERGGRLTQVGRREPKARHGRRESRRLWALADPALNRYVGSSGEHGTAWPHVQQLCRIERERLQVRAGRVVKQQREVTYAITSLPAGRADAAALLSANRRHWQIENGSHWVRDVVPGEDACLIRSGAAPQVLAACRNLTLALLRRAGYDGIAAALRTLAARPAVAVALVCSSGTR